MKKNIIPVMHCFDNNYVIPAGVSFYSMLKNSDKNCFYKLYVLHSDITEDNQFKLQECIKEFPNASLEFINMKNKFVDLFTNTQSKSHYSKEMYYKFLAPSIFKEYDKIIITDVDVVWLRDISKCFIEFDVNDDYYLAGVSCLTKKNSWLTEYLNNYNKDFTKEEIELLRIGAGYMIYNLRKMRNDSIEEKFIEFANKNSQRLILPEQDTINIICGKKIKFLSPDTMVCTCAYELYKNEEDLENDTQYSKDVVKFALENPVQLHYISGIKPWNTFDCTKSEIWFKYLLESPLKSEVKIEIASLSNKITKKMLSLTHKNIKMSLLLQFEKRS